MSGYNYRLEYRQGVLNANADALSRLPLPASEDDISQEVAGVHMMELVHAPVSEEDVAQQTAADPVLSIVIQQVLKGWKLEDKDATMKPFSLR